MHRTTSLRVQYETRDRVLKLAKYGESADGVIRKLLDLHGDQLGAES